jgi:Questin oxidase-like
LVTRALVDGRYARAYLDFFEDEVVRSNYDWKRVVQRYVVDGDEPLLSGLISGGLQDLFSVLMIACHPLIHLAYAYELNNVEVAAEGIFPKISFFANNSSGSGLC